MNYLHRVEIWGDRHHPKWLDFIRIALGAFLCYKAISFLVDMSYLVSIMRAGINTDINAFLVVFFGQFIVIVTLLSGIFLIFGMYTRLICALQIFILIGAIVLLNRSGTAAGAILETVVTLLLLVVFLVAGNGQLSFNNVKEDRHATQ
jgi:uncharacterized membrane protein YphA (DoxX/SURF4 family)